MKAFNPNRLLGVYIPTWISLTRLPLEYTKFAESIASVVGKVLWEDAFGDRNVHPRFCVDMDLTQGWVFVVLTYNPLGGNAII